MFSRACGQRGVNQFHPGPSGLEVKMSNLSSLNLRSESGVEER